MSRHLSTAAWLSMLLLGAPSNAEIPELLKSAADDLQLHPVTKVAVRHAVRQVTASSSITYTITIAPDMTCGFLSASAGNAITCTNGKRCAWEGNRIGAVFCGFEKTDRAYNRCIPRSVATDPSLCNDVCQSNEFNLLCTGTDTPFCRTYAFPDGVRDYRCASSSLASAQGVSFTYSGQTGRTLTTSALTDDTTTTARPVPSITMTPDPTTTPTIPNPISTGPIVTDPPEPDNDDGPALGPIIGGAVGGVAVLALILTGIFFLVRRSKRNDQNIQGGVAGGHPNQPAPPAYPASSVGYAGAVGGGSPPGQMQQMYPHPAASPATTYDSSFKPGVGNLSPTTPSIMTMTSPSAVAHNEYMYAGGQGEQKPPAWVSTPSPPPVQQQPQAYIQQQNTGGYPQQAQQTQQVQQGPVYEIGTVEDQHRGRLSELS